LKLKLKLKLKRSRSEPPKLNYVRSNPIQLCNPIILEPTKQSDPDQPNPTQPNPADCQFPDPFWATARKTRANREEEKTQPKPLINPILLLFRRIIGVSTFALIWWRWVLWGTTCSPAMPSQPALPLRPPPHSPTPSILSRPFSRYWIIFARFWYLFWFSCQGTVANQLLIPFDLFVRLVPGRSTNWIYLRSNLHLALQVSAFGELL
jgi:hypothetical protein